MKLRTTIAISVATFLLLTSCSSSSDDASTNDGTDKKAQAGDSQDTTKDVPAGSGSDGGSGTLEMDGATIKFDSVRCHMKPQDAAAGGGKILYVAQATGVDAQGGELMIDVSRYDEDSQFAGDSVNLVVGDPTDPDAVSYEIAPGGNKEVVKVDGSTVSADGVELFADAQTTATVSFKVDC